MKWSFGAAAGLALVNVLGVVSTELLAGGFVLDGVAGALGLFVMGLMWAYQGEVRFFRVPVPVRTAGTSVGPSANARKRRRPRSRAPRRRRPAGG